MARRRKVTSSYCGGLTLEKSSDEMDYTWHYCKGSCTLLASMTLTVVIGEINPAGCMARAVAVLTDAFTDMALLGAKS